MSTDESIKIRGARVNNLRNVSVDIPRGKLIVVTGVSGSGKSSLAFDTLYAEGQRRYAESLSSYARQFLGRMSKPDVDSIEGIPPAIAVEQKVTVRNPRSTVATTTEIYDYLRLVYARIGHTFSPVSGREVHADTVQDIANHIATLTADVIYLLADIGWSRRTDKVELMLSLKEQGFNRLYAAGRPIKIEDVMQMGPDAPAEAWLLIDRFRPESPMSDDTRARLLESAAQAFRMGSGDALVVSASANSASPASDTAASPRHFCERFELDGITFRRPDEYLFNFNSPLGACPVCGGLGKITGISEDLVIPDKTRSIYDGCIACWRGEKMSWFKDQIVRQSERLQIPVFTPWCNLSDTVKTLIWEGEPQGTVPEDDRLVGINEFFAWVETQRYKIQYKYMLSRFSGRATCHSCHGSRLRKEALYVRVAGLPIDRVLAMTVDEAVRFFEEIMPEDGATAADNRAEDDGNRTEDAGNPAEATGSDGTKQITITRNEAAIASEPLAEIRSRLRCIQDVGLGYLTLDRSCNTLSGGESQRINLVTALGSSLVGSMYVLDEPSIGLHPRDTERLIGVLKRLRDLGNTVVVVEHDEEIIRSADLLLDIGPRAGVYGGEIVYKGLPDADVPQKVLDSSLTLQYLRGIRTRYRREVRPWTYSIVVKGAMEHNLKDIDVQIPLGVLTVVTGVSGSGKSSLVGDILYPALFRHLNESGDQPGTFRGLDGSLDRITKVEYVDQNPLGKSTRSNAATYLKVYDLIRKLLSDQQFAKINGFGPSHFSFNQDGGRCPECQGEGVVRIEMQFISDVTMVCEECGGKRFRSEVLEVRYRGRNIDDILNMSVDEAVEFFAAGTEPEAATVAERLKALQQVGLGYIKLGQSSSTLSGGESQRIKLAYYLSVGSETGKRDRIMFIFDEPTTGLHFHDIEKLLRSFDALTAAGHSVVVVEHNLDVIRSADWVIDLGPDAGSAGGRVVFAGTPSDLALADTITAKYLKG